MSRPRRRKIAGNEGSGRVKCQSNSSWSQSPRESSDRRPVFERSRNATLRNDGECW